MRKYKKEIEENEVTYGYFNHNGKKYRYDKEGMHCIIFLLIVIAIAVLSFAIWQMVKPDIPEVPEGYEKLYSTKYVETAEDVISICQDYLENNEVMSDTYSSLDDLLLDVEVTNHKNLEDMEGYIYIPVIIESEF